MLIHYRQYTDIFHSKSPTKSLFVEKKTVKIGTILSRKSSKYPAWLAMCNVYIRNELPTGLPARFNNIIIIIMWIYMAHKSTFDKALKVHYKQILNYNIAYKI